MLYERWRRIAREQAREIALRDLSCGSRWTFEELARIAEGDSEAADPVVCASGTGAEFVFSVLRAWRWGKVLCPIEPGQSPPALQGLSRGIVHLKTTSATTGAPRQIAFTAEQLMADADNIVATMGLRPDWPNLGVISLAHSYGFSNLVLPLVLHGIPLVLSSSPLPEMVREAARTNPDITLPAVPALWHAWHDAKAISPNIRLAISAGAPLPAGLEEDVYHATGVKLHNFYGASECGGIAYDASTAPRADGTCAGTPMENVSVSVAEDGCLEIRSRAVAQTYWPEPESGLGGGCYRTSDLAEMSNGLVFLRGRANDQINVAGRKISPEAVEGVLRTHPEVADCLVFGAPSAEAGRSEMIVACVAARTPVSGEALRQFLLARIPGWQVPRDWWFVSELGANRRGKLSRQQWRQRYAEEGSRRAPG